MKTQVQIMNGIPDKDVPSTVALLQADPRYLSHKVIPEGGGTNTIEATFRVDD
jgi:hypothetical protein